MNPERRRAARLLSAIGALALTPRADAQGTSLDATTWPFEPPLDGFRPESLLDLRSLNEKIAGQSGFVRVGPHGGFLRGDGQALRFWAVNTDVGRGAFVASDLGPKTAPDLARHARFLAKRGVNMVRLHRQLPPNLAATPGAAITDIDLIERDGIWRTVAAMRKEGIYTTISPYWSAAMKLSPAWGLAGGARQSAFGLLFFDPVLESGYRAWLRRLLVETNPYTGLALANDPSLALIQLQNEDSLLFWTLGTLGAEQRRALEERFGVFLAAKYGSIVNTRSAWKGDHAAGDSPDAARMALLDLSELAAADSDSRSGHGIRLADQTEFFARTMHDFNARTVTYLREVLGAKQLVNAGNWKTANTVRLGDAERWSYGPGEVDAVNVYTAGVHQGPNNGWAIQNGDRFTSQSVLLNPGMLPINLKQTQGRPMLVTEGGWIQPNGFGAEGPFLVAAYSSLSGVAGYYWFSTSEEAWSQPQSANGYLPSQAKWIFADPDTLGTFPAAALAYRMGYIDRGSPAVLENRSLRNLWDRKTPVISEAASFDPNRDVGDGILRPGAKGAVPAEAFLVGPVETVHGADPALSTAAPLGKWIEPGVIRSNTGQIVFNSSKGYCTIDAPRAQGVAAHFRAAPRHQLSDVRFNSGNSFGAAMAVSLDGAPLRTSRRVLLQFGTQSRPAGWRELPAHIAIPGQAGVQGFELQSYGHAPWRVERADLEVAIRNPSLVRATVLDMNGMAIGEVAIRRSGDEISLQFPATAMYVVLR